MRLRDCDAKDEGHGDQSEEHDQSSPYLQASRAARANDLSVGGMSVPCPRDRYASP